MGNISNTTGDKYKNLIENIHGETKNLSKSELRKFINNSLWGKPFKELDDILEQLINARVNKKMGEEEVMPLKPNKFKYKIEDLVGRKFRLGLSNVTGDVFTISGVNKGEVIITWYKSNKFHNLPKSVGYTVYQVLDNIELGNWILEEL